MPAPRKYPWRDLRRGEAFYSPIRPENMRVQACRTAQRMLPIRVRFSCRPATGRTGTIVTRVL